MTYFPRRFMVTIPVMIAAATVVFAIMQILPGDVALVILGGDQGAAPSPERVEALRAALSLDEPLLERYGDWIKGLFTFDLGRSYFTGESINHALSNRMPITALLVLLSTAISTLVSVPLGIISALRRNSVLDVFVRFFCSAGYSIPNFFLAMLLVLVLANTIGWYQPLAYAKPLEDPLTLMSQLLVPATCLGYRQAAVQARMVRSSMLDVMNAEHVRTADAKGLSRPKVVLWHGFRSALLPVITITGLEIVVLFSGAVVIETFFNIPGMGSFLVDGALRRDVPVVQGAVFAIVGVVVLVNLLVDLTYGWLDPRTRTAK